MKNFSTSDILIQKLERMKQSNLELASEDQQRKLAEEIAAQMRVILPFTEEERKPEAVKARLAKCSEDFFYWDRTYFPPEMYDEYFPSGWFHQEIVQLMDLRDKKAHVIHGPRDSGKTATAKKKFLYNFLHGKRRYQLIGSETLSPAENAVIDMLSMLDNNERLKHDYKLQWHQANSENLFAKSTSNPAGTYIGTLSEERSSRGKQREFFLRPDLIYLTDFENDTSSLTKDAVERRITRINEMRTSLSSNGTLLWEGNNFNVSCAMQYLFLEKERDVLSEEFVMHKFPAWDPSRRRNKRSIWFERFPAAAEEEMRKMCKPMDDHDWNGNFQGSPTEKSGDIFPDAFYAEYAFLPKDLRAIGYTDPNCSLKEKGDTTASGFLGFSVNAQKYYIVFPRCKSYSDPNELIEDFLIGHRELGNTGVPILARKFDGHVSQESVWTNFLQNFSQLKNIPLPYIEFARYNVDDLATNASREWKAGKFLFPQGFRKTEEGKRFTNQIFKFKTKKAKKKDDAADWLICALQVMSELAINSLGGSKPDFRSISKRRIQRAP